MVKGYYFILTSEILNKKLKLNGIIHYIRKKGAKNTAVLVCASSKWILVQKKSEIKRGSSITVHIQLIVLIVISDLEALNIYWSKIKMNSSLSHSLLD